MAIKTEATLGEEKSCFRKVLLFLHKVILYLLHLKNVRIQNKLQPKYLFSITCIQYTFYLFTDPLLLTVLTGSLLENSVEKNYIGLYRKLSKLKKKVKRFTCISLGEC